MQEACGGSDAGGAWDWKSAYDACEAAAVVFLRRFGGAMGARAGAPSALLAMLAKVADLLPSHTRRSEESETFQQFSTPLPLAFVAAAAAAIAPADRVLEPSAGTGLLAIFAELAGATLVLNELADTRAGLLCHLFPGVAVTRFDAARIDDHLGAGVTPTVVLMNPPFSALANVDRSRTDAALRHVSSALARLAEGGRLVAVTQASLAPDNPAWRDDFVRLQERGTVVFSAAIDGAVYARHGTTIDTRLTVIDKRSAADATVFPASPGTAPDAATLLRWVMESVPLRLPIADAASEGTTARCERSAPGRTRARIAWVPSRPSSPSPAASGDVVELAYDTADWKPAGGGRLSEALYEDYALQSIRIPGAHAHPTRLNPYAERKIRMTSFNIYRVRFIQSQRHAINISAPNAELAEFFAEEIRRGPALPPSRLSAIRSAPTGTPRRSARRYPRPPRRCRQCARPAQARRPPLDHRRMPRQRARPRQGARQSVMTAVSLRPGRRSGGPSRQHAVLPSLGAQRRRIGCFSGSDRAIMPRSQRS